ncbi:hypothetical protein KCU74_g96, partial [Aureobasidium melanogenum]
MSIGTRSSGSARPFSLQTLYPLSNLRPMAQVGIPAPSSSQKNSNLMTDRCIYGKRVSTRVCILPRRAPRRRPYTSTRPKAASGTPFIFSTIPLRRYLLVGALLKSESAAGGYAI